MKIIKPVVFMIIITCCGCVSERFWYNKNRTYQGARADCWECILQARTEVNGLADQNENASDKSSKVSEADMQKIIDKCMTDKGYKNTWDFNLEYNVRKSFFEYKDRQYNIAGK